MIFHSSKIFKILLRNLFLVCLKIGKTIIINNEKKVNKTKNKNRILLKKL